MLNVDDEALRYQRQSHLGLASCNILSRTAVVAVAPCATYLPLYASPAHWHRRPGAEVGVA